MKSNYLSSTKLFCCIIFLILNTSLSAEIHPKWNVTLESPVIWQRVSPTGNLVVCTKDALHGIDAEKGGIIWRLPSLGNTPAEHYEELPNTFFVQIINNNDVIILDPTEGKIIYDSRASGFTAVFVKNILYSSGTLLVYGFKGSLKPFMSLYEISTGKELWSRDDVFKKEGTKTNAFAGLMEAASASSGSGSFEMIEVNQDQVIIATGSGIFMVNIKTGGQIWSAALPKPKGAVSTSEEMKLFRSPVDPVFYYGKSNYLMAYNVADGAQVWNEVVKISGIVDQIIYLREGLVLCPKIDPNNTMFKPAMVLVDYKTGATSWGKNNNGLKLDGGVTNYNFTSAGVVISMQNDSKSFLNILDPKAGRFIFEKSLKIKGILDYSEITPNGLMYITKSDAYTNGEVNFFDMQTGKTLLKNSIESGKPLSSTNYDPSKYRLLRSFKDDKMYVFSNKDMILYEVDKSTATYKALSGKVTLQGKEEANALELMDNGIALISDQNLVLFGFDGSIQLQKYHEAPRLSGIMRALLTARAVAASYDAARYGMAAAAFNDAATKTDDPLSMAIFDGMGKGLSAASESNMAYSKAAMNAAKARFKASANSKDFVFMMVNLPERNKSYGLAKVNKVTGEIVEVIDMKKDKDPNYEVDEISNMIYYRENPNQIVCYKL